MPLNAQPEQRAVLDLEKDLQEIYPSYMWRDTESEATESEFGTLFPRECTKGTSQKLASILGEADDTTDAVRMVTGIRATYGSLAAGGREVPPPQPQAIQERVVPTYGGHHDPQPLVDSRQDNFAPRQCGSLTSATSQSRLRTLQESPALPGPNTCRKNSAQSHTRSLPVTGVPQQSVQQPVQQPVQKPVQQPTPCQSEPQVLLPPVPSSPLTAQNLAKHSDSVQPQLAEMCRSKTLEVLRDQTASRRHGIPMHNTMLARLSNDDLREENAQLKSEIVALRMEISKRRAGVAQSDVSCTSHQVRMLIA